VQAEQAVTQPASPDSCGYQVTTAYHSRWNGNGYLGMLELKNVSGVRATDFQVYADLHGAAPSLCLLANCVPVEGGYTFTPPSLFRLLGLSKGQTYPIPFMSRDAYQGITPYVISVNGVVCDKTPPTVSLNASGSFYTANGTLTLTATASDNVAVKKVVFSLDGQVIATDYTAPYALDVPISETRNGRHRFTATAYDMAGNSATSGAKSVFTAIGNKFFGTAVTTAADYTNLLSYFDQITPGNAGKWGSVEAVQGTFNWTDLDTAYNFAKSNNLPFKFHNLIWGSQQPSWITSLSAADQLAAIDAWLAAVAARYPSLDMIDVVNEPLHSPPPYAAALGGSGTTGWDWVITAFQMARQHFPNSQLLINDYSVLSLASTTQSYLTIINLLNNQGLIDGIGEQGHFYERSPDLSTLASNLNSLAAAGLPIYISELDLNFANDAQQALRMSQLFPIFWSNPSVVGVTHWGYLQGTMWQTDAYLVNSDGSLRPALTWLECYMGGGTNCPVPTYVPQPHAGTCSGITLEAEQFDAASGLLAAGNVVAYANDGSWFAFDQVAFNSNWTSLSVTYALGSSSPINLSVYLGSVSTAPVATVQLTSTGSWSTMNTVSIPWVPLSTTQDVYVQFNGGGANVDKVQFLVPSGAMTNVIPNGTFESGTYYWYTWSGGTAATSAARAHGGAQSLLISNRTANAPAATNIASFVTPGTSYPFSLWVSIDSTATGGANASMHVTQATQCQGASAPTYSWIGNPISIPNGNSWTQFSGTIAVPNCTLASLQIYVEGDAGPDLYVDDVQVLQSVCAPTNLVTDGTFESGQGGWFGWGESSLGVTNTSAHSGSYSLEGVGMSSGAIARDISGLVAAGKKYQATAWVSVSNLASGSGSVNWQTVQNCDGATSDSYPWLTGVTANNGAWVQATGVVDLTACTKINKLYLFAGAASGNLYIDDVSLTPL